MQEEVKNNVLKIENVICFYVEAKCPSKDIDEIKDKEKDDWSYQDYLTMACAKKKYRVHWLNKKTVRYTFANGIINIDDDLSNEHFSISNLNKYNTVVFQGQSNDDMTSNYEGLMRAFELIGLYMFNTIEPIKIASDKFLSANLLSSQNIPQPKYVLVSHDIIEQENPENRNDISICPCFEKMLDNVNNNASIDDADEGTKYVVKILGGSLGIGVFLCNREEITGILQTIFAIDDTAELIIQEFKKNTGDIRVHVFSVDGIHYEVLACMKRNKIKGDFRSNVSLGATTDEYTLTPEQEKIVMDTAKISGCKWVGVDLMECEDGSSVVIEYNSSPGVQGISEQIKHNMFEVVFNKIEENADKIKI